MAPQNSTQSQRTKLPRSLRLMRSLIIFFAILSVGIILIVEFVPGQSPVKSDTTTTTKAPVTTTTVPPPWSSAAKGLYSYASYQTTLTEPGTNLCVHINGVLSCGPRQLGLGVYYPVLASDSNSVPYRGSNELPLVLFAPGYYEYYWDYAPLLQSLVSAGYVVIGINFPLNDPSSPGGANENDILNQPKDMSSVISWAIGENNSPTSKLFGLMNLKDIVATGQSDGGDTALALSYNTCCTDARVAAAVIYSGAELATFPGVYFSAGQDIPLLVAQGTNDTINPQALSQQIYALAPAPKFYLSLLGEDHLSAYTEPNSYEQVVAAVTVDFIDGYVLHENASALQMTTDGNHSGISTLTSDP